MNYVDYIKYIYLLTKRKVKPNLSFDENCKNIISKSTLCKIYNKVIYNKNKSSKSKGGSNDTFIIPNLELSYPPNNDYTHIFLYIIALLLFLISYFVEHNQNNLDMIYTRITQYLQNGGEIYIQNIINNTISSITRDRTNRAEIVNVSPEITEQIPISYIDIIEECPICHENFNEERLRTLLIPCSHFFCSKCLEENCKVNKTKCFKCSICRQNVTKGLVIR